MALPYSVGERVICRKTGPYDGKRGRVEDIWRGAVLVHFQNSSIIESADCFEKA
jgi:hypothetical protein